MDRRQLFKTLPAGFVMLQGIAENHADTGASAVTSATGGHRLFLGTNGGESKGIYVTRFRNGQCTAPVLAAEASKASFLALPPHPGNLLFAVTTPEKQNSEASSFHITVNAEAVTLEPVANASAQSPGGTHLSTTEDGRCVFVANYAGASIASFSADRQGHLTLASHIAFPPDEHGPVPGRQTQSHAHSILPSPDGNFVLVNDLGLDRIHIFRLDRNSAKLTPNNPAQWKSAPGAGPRHLAYHPNGKWIYCVNEMHCTIDQLQWAPTHGALTTKSTVSTLPPGVAAEGNRACEAVFSKDLRFLYASNRVHESFTVYSVDAETGALSPIQYFENPGKESRHIAIDPTGGFFLSANQFSNEISVFPIDAASGKLGARVSQTHLGAPSCLLFA